MLAIFFQVLKFFTNLWVLLLSCCLLSTNQFPALFFPPGGLISAGSDSTDCSSHQCACLPNVELASCCCSGGTSADTSLDDLVFSDSCLPRDVILQASKAGISQGLDRFIVPFNFLSDSRHGNPQPNILSGLIFIRDKIPILT